MSRILVVDDNEQNLYMLQALLSGHGYDVATAANGAVALQQARNNPPTAIVSDILMPVMDGFELCRQWKGDETLRHIPFVFYTATYTDPQDEEFALSLGAERFIVKPQEPDAFLEILMTVLRDAEAGQLHSSRPAETNTEVVLREYNEALIRKLDDKIAQLADANKRLEQEMAQRQALVADLTHMSRVSMMGEMATVLAHEVNQPLSAICNYAAACVRLLAREGIRHDELGDALAQIDQQARRASEIINRLKQFVAKTVPRLSPVHLNELVREVGSFMEHQMRMRQTTLQLELDDALPTVHADAIQIQQVLVNLLQNAVESMEDVAPGARRIIVTTTTSPAGAQVEVHDHGRGFSADVAEKLFEPYFTTKPDGLGMGLNISRRIIEAHGGRLSAVANPDGGATFQFTLPVTTDESSRKTSTRWAETS